MGIRNWVAVFSVLAICSGIWVIVTSLRARESGAPMDRRPVLVMLMTLAGLMTALVAFMVQP